MSIQVGATPLHIAACYGYTETARMLIENGATVDMTEKVCTLVSMKCVYYRIVII